MKKLAILFCLIVLSCHSGPKFRTLHYHEEEMPAPSKDIQLPTKLWILFENPTLEARNENAPQKQTEFMGLRVFLYEKNNGILGGENHRLIFPPAGGELDLKDFVTDKSGSFYFLAEPISKIENPEIRVYFLSNSEERKLGREVFGSGCNTYYEVSSAFKKAMSKEGFLINTTDQRHVSSLAGTFFFIIEDGQKLHLARLTVKDSRYPSLHCNP